MIVVATEDFRLYHEAVTALRERGVTFTTIEPTADLPTGTTVVIAGERDRISLDDRPDVELVRAAPDSIRPAIEAALSILRGGDGRFVVGVDPGANPGIAVLSGETVVAAFQVPLTEAVDVIESEIEDATNPLVRIGDGARLQGARIVNGLSDASIELVDETGTTPYLGSGARGMGDVLAAVNIARLEGEPIGSREIEPTAGELERIKTESRARSDGDRTISESLARDVAAGERTIDEAIAAHRKRAEDDGPD
ncbi:MAG: hypothetical protein ACQETB_02885 [Halobacteriota archaeon]